MYNFSGGGVTQATFCTKYDSKEQLNNNNKKNQSQFIVHIKSRQTQSFIQSCTNALVWELLRDNSHEKVTSGSEVGVEWLEAAPVDESKPSARRQRLTAEYWRQ